MGLVAAAVLLAPQPATPQTGSTLPGIDVLERDGFAVLNGLRIGLITNVTGRTANGRSSLEVLAAAPGVQLRRLFSPEHSLSATLEGSVEDGVHASTGLPVVSLYAATAETRRPSPEALSGLDALVFDIQDIGTRFYTYASTLGYAMEAAAEHGVAVFVLDRPNPIGGLHVSGPAVVDEPAFVAYAPIAIRHGMTIGELAGYFNEELGIGAQLTVVRMSGWERALWFDETGLEWVNPSPNMRNLTQALLYPAVGPVETTNVSVGRGTDAPFEWIGAPWIQSRQLAAALNRLALPGLRFVPRRLTPSASVHAGVDCGGVNLLVTDREAFDAGRTAAALMHTLARLYPGQWETASLPRLWGDGRIVPQLQAGTSIDAIVDAWAGSLRRFRAQRERYLLYR